MKNRTCRTCEQKFHYCGSCDLSGSYEDEYCTHKCWLESLQRKGLYENAHKVVRSLSDVGKDALRWLLGIPDKSYAILENVLEEAPPIELQYDSEYGDEKLCKCGHSYDRHFDSYDCMKNIGCKYCPCHTFTEKPPEAPKP